MPSEKLEAIARRAWEEWETLTGRPLEERPPSVHGAGVFALLVETEQKLGWAVYPPGILEWRRGSLFAWSSFL